ncbi:MAG: hypothetical protein ACRC33_23045 [Gemmataceae bacterium]
MTADKPDAGSLSAPTGTDGSFSRFTRIWPPDSDASNSPMSRLRRPADSWTTSPSRSNPPADLLQTSGAASPRTANW